MMLIWVFTAAAVLCLVYYGVIVLYAGFGTSFAVLWLLIGQADDREVHANLKNLGVEQVAMHRH